MPRGTTITIQPGDDGPPYHSHPHSLNSEEDSFRHDSHGEYSHTDAEWAEEYDEEEEDDVLPSDSASASNDGPLRPPLRSAPRRHGIPHQQQHYPHSVQSHAPNPPSSLDQPEEYGHHGRGYHQQPTRGAYYPQRGHAPGYPQSHVAPYMGQYPGGNQMVPYGGYNPNPFSPSPMSNGSNGAASYFNPGDPRPMYDMAPYQSGYYPGPHGHYNLPAQMQQFHLSPPPPEAPAQSASPNPKEEQLEAQLAAMKAEQEKAKEAEKQRDREAQIRRDAEEAFQRRMEDMKRAQDEAKKEIEKAKAEAERAARARMEAERKAEEERARQHAEAMKRAEDNARLKFEAEIKAAEERRRKEEVARVKAEETARIRLEAAIKAEGEARAAAERRKAEEAARLKQVQEDAKRKAEADTLAKVEADKQAAKKAAEAAEVAKQEAEALKKRIQEETRAKMEEAKKKAEKAPIKFKDAVGRKFSFPFHLCATWQGMEDLIKQAFLQVDVLGPHVQEGHYDLIGPNGDIILPSVWEKVVEPDWAITMTMWPMDKTPLMRPPGFPPGMPPGRPGAHHPGHPFFDPMRPGQSHPGRPRPPGGMPGGIPPPAGWSQRPRGPHLPAGVDIIQPEPPKSSKSKRNSALHTFLSGKTKKKSSKK